MGQISDVMTRDHKTCDESFFEAEAAARDGDWPRTVAAVNAYRDALERHFRIEEAALFPAFEGATGATEGPTAVMRAEHDDMRDLLDQLRTAAVACEADEFLGIAETLSVVMQQHNFKEEQVLYALLDETLGDEVAALLEEVAHV